MPKQRMSLRMIKDVIRLKWQAKLSHEQIATTLNISKGAVAKYVGLATVAGLDWPTVQAWSEQQLSAALLPRAEDTTHQNRALTAEYCRIYTAANTA